MFQAINDRIVIQLDEIKNESPIYLDNKPIRNKGIVVNVGNKVTSVKAGDHVLFHQFDELPLPREGYVIIRERSLLGIYVDSQQG